MNNYLNAGLLFGIGFITIFLTGGDATMFVFAAALSIMLAVDEHRQRQAKRAALAHKARRREREAKNDARRTDSFTERRCA